MRFAVLFVAVTLSAQTVSVEMLKQFIHSAVERKQPDKLVAQTLQHMKLSEKLTDDTIEELQSAGAGPRTVAALKELGTVTAKLAPPAPPPPPKEVKPIPSPSYEDQQSILREVRDYALNFSKNLPDYICTQMTRRFYDPTGKENWRKADEIATKLSYFDQKEKYQVMLYNGAPTQKSMDQLGGTTSQGEFGSLLKGIFEPRTDAEFHWERWGNLRGHLCHVYKYTVDQEHSEWSIYDGEAKQSVIPAYEGEVFADNTTHQILRVTLESVNIPSDFRVRVAKSILDYDYQTISDQKFLLPMKLTTRLDDNRHYQSRNDVEFRNYRKFSADTVLTFDTDAPAPLDETKTKEQPITPVKKP
jgi:hypothetical protein